MSKIFKTQSTVEIPVLQHLGAGQYYFHFNHSKGTNEDKETVYNADTIRYDHKPEIKEIQEDIGRELFKEELEKFQA